MYVLDTDHISIVQHRDDPLCDLILSEAAKVGEDDLFTTVISFQEQALGWHNRLARAKTKKDVVFGYRRFETMLNFFAGARVLSFDEAAADCFEELHKARTRVGLMDLRIAAIVIANQMTLVTRNRNDFDRIPGLRIVDWTRPRI